MTVTATLELHLRPEAVADAGAVISATLAQTRAFAGCEGVEVLEDSADPAHLIVLERWQSAEADAAYRAWRLTPDGASELGSVLAGAPTLTKLTTTAL